MGQYFIAVNKTRREYIHPHRFGDGQKFMEFSESSCFLAGLALLLRQSSQGGGGDWLGYSAPHDALAQYPCVGSWVGVEPHAISIVGDYDVSGLYHDAQGSYTDISFDVMRAMATDSYMRTRLSESVQWCMNGSFGALAADDGALAKYKAIFEEDTFQQKATQMPDADKMAMRYLNREEGK